MLVKFLLDFRTMKLQIYMKFSWKHFNPNLMSRIDHIGDFISLTCSLRIMHMLSFGELFIYLFRNCKEASMFLIFYDFFF